MRADVAAMGLVAAVVQVFVTLRSYPGWFRVYDALRLRRGPCRYDAVLAMSTRSPQRT